MILDIISIIFKIITLLIYGVIAGGLFYGTYKINEFKECFDNDNCELITKETPEKQKIIRGLIQMLKFFGLEKNNIHIFMIIVVVIGGLFGLGFIITLGSIIYNIKKMVPEEKKVVIVEKIIEKIKEPNTELETKK